MERRAKLLGLDIAPTPAPDDATITARLALRPAAPPPTAASPGRPPGADDNRCKLVEQIRLSRLVRPI